MVSDRKLTLVHVDTARGWRGGQAQVEALVRRLAERGHSVTLVTPEGSPLAERLASSPVEIVADRPRGEWDIGAGLRLRRLARSRGADLIHAHSARAHAVARWASGRGGGPPIVVSRRVDFPVGGNWFSRRKYLDKGCYYLAISTAVRDVLVRGGVEPRRIFLVPSGVDPGKFSYSTDRAATRRSLGLGEEDFLVCNVAALVDHKDQATLVQAAAIAVEKDPRLRFIVLGEGELRADLEALVSRLGLGGRFRLLGFKEDVEPYLAASDLFVLSSHLEGMCTSLLDAMLLGLPVVATRAGGIPDVVVDGETGLLVEVRRPDALAEAILEMVREPALRARLAKAGRRKVREHFTVERTVELTEAAYFRIIELRRSGS